MLIRKLCFIISLLLLCGFINAQDSTYVQQKYEQLKKTQRSIKTKDDKASAKNFLELGDEAFEQSDYKKSEEYYKKSLYLYEKLQNKGKIAKVSRKLAQAQELLNKPDEAYFNYNIAQQNSVNREDLLRNTNDAQRVSVQDFDVKLNSVNQNISLNTELNDSVELSQNYRQLADIQIEKNELEEAETSLTNAYNISRASNVNQALEINEELANVYVKKNEINKAIEVKKQVLEEDFVKEKSEKNVVELQNLAKLYAQGSDKEEAINTLKEAYKISMDKGHTIEAKNSLQKLDSIYTSKGKTTAILPLYKDYLHKLPEVLEKDNSLVNQKLLNEAEEKVNLLEKEQQTQQKYIESQSTLNWVLIGSIILLSGLLLALFLFFRKLKIRNKKIQLQSLRREMNPHFIFNSLNSLNSYIATHNELESNQFLTKFSTLMRQVMKHSNNDFLPLETELEMLKTYLELEKKRFEEHFDYTLNVDDSLIEKNIEVPGMLIQPFVENAIWHGLRYKEEKGHLKVEIQEHKNQVLVTIEDDGIGIKESKQLKTKHQKQHESRGLHNNMERISLLNDLYNKNIKCKVLDKENASGVLVSLSFEQ